MWPGDCGSSVVGTQSSGWCSLGRRPMLMRYLSRVGVAGMPVGYHARQEPFFNRLIGVLTGILTWVKRERHEADEGGQENDTHVEELELHVGGLAHHGKDA